MLECIKPIASPKGNRMVQVEIDSIRVSLMSQHRIVILKDLAGERFLPIWIGPYEAEAITVALQEMEVARPLTHDLLRNALQALGAEVERIDIVDLRDPSDALALAVRVHVPIFVDERVMREASTEPEGEVKGDEPAAGEGDKRLDIFKDFVDSLDMDGMDAPEGDAPR
jgi:uncharacterized protein